MQSLAQILLLLIEVAWFILIAYIIISWLVSFQVLNLRQPLVAQIYYGLRRVTEPVFAPIRRFIPNMGGLDFAPLVVLLGLAVMRIVITNNFLY